MWEFRQLLMGDIDQPVLATEGHGGLGPFFCQREEPCAGSSTQNNGKGAVDWKDQGKSAHEAFASCARLSELSRFPRGLNSMTR
jgi:hypothetical protein